MIAESYIVRIYRRNPNHPDRMEGILLAVSAESSQAFHSGAELLRLLTLPAENRDVSRPGGQE
jgi:hypothetical protein